MVRVAKRCREIAEELTGFDFSRLNIMEVCGTHAHSIARYGLEQLLPENITHICGPGCPVCVTHDDDLDAVVQIARQGAIIATFGDMMKVPGPRGSLGDARSAGADIRILYSPMQALEIAADNPDAEVVFLGIGFETTVPGVAVTVQTAAEQKLQNFSVYCSHKLIPPAMEVLVQDPECQIDAFMCPGHVSTIIGTHAYGFLAADYAIPCAVAGFGPVDIMEAVLALARQQAVGEAKVENCYTRAVQPEGNPKAREQMGVVFEPAEALWRGLGEMPQSGLAIRPEYSDYDAADRFSLQPPLERNVAGCLCGEVLQGKINPQSCPSFGTACTPDNPLGPCMVSSEGACAAAYKYART
ncbi:MAG: hydrogenase formation protein HypD [Armatimonadota bacterium]